MKSIKLIIVSFALINLMSCEKSRVCECTSVYSDGRANTVETHETLDNTSSPDCSSYVGTEVDNGVTITTTCQVVDS